MKKRFVNAPTVADLAELQRANLLADQADAAVKENGRVRLNYSRAGRTLVVHFPEGTDLWAVLKRCDEWAKASAKTQPAQAPESPCTSQSPVPARFQSANPPA